MSTLSPVCLPEEPATILYVGVGSAHFVRDLCRAGEVTVLTPDGAELAAPSEFREHPSFRMLHGRLPSIDGSRELSVYQIHDLSSFREPTGVLKDFPGLEVQRTSSPKCIDVGVLRDVHRTRAGGRNLFVLNLGGDEAEVVALMARAGYLATFQNVAIFCAPYGWYAGALGSDAISERMHSVGFRLLFFYHDGWGRRVLVFENNVAQRIVASQRARLRSAKKVISDQRKAIARLRKQSVILGGARGSDESNADTERVARERDQLAKEVALYADKVATWAEEVEVLRTQLQLCQQQREELARIGVATDREVERLRNIVRALDDTLRRRPAGSGKGPYE